MFACRISSCTTFTSSPFPLRSVAYVCRNVCQPKWPTIPISFALAGVCPSPRSEVASLQCIQLKHVSCGNSSVADPGLSRASTGMFSAVVADCHFAALFLLEFLRGDVSATRAIHVAKHTARCNLLKDDQAFVVVAINKKSRIVQRLELIGLVVVGQL